MLKTHRTLIFALLIGIGATDPVFASNKAQESAVKWISLYDGNETQFSSRDRNRVLEALNTLGINYREQASSGGILVNAPHRALIQDLIAKIFTKSSRVSPRSDQ